MNDAENDELTREEDRLLEIAKAAEADAARAAEAKQAAYNHWWQMLAGEARDDEWETYHQACEVSAAADLAAAAAKLDWEKEKAWRIYEEASERHSEAYKDTQAAMRREQATWNDMTVAHQAWETAMNGPQATENDHE